MAVVGIGAVGTAGAQVRCVDAAREAARLAARGESGRAVEVARRIAPGGAAVDVRVAGDTVRAEVSAESAFPGVRVSASAEAAMEPGVDGADDATG